MSHSERYNMQMKDVELDPKGGPEASIGTIMGCHYKITKNIAGKEKAWRFNSVCKDWVLAERTVEKVKNIFRMKRAEQNRVR